MKVSISTIKRDKVFLVLCLEQGVTKDAFAKAVQSHYLRQGVIPFSFFTETHDDTLSMVVIPDINNDHDEPQQTIDI